MKIFRLSLLAALLSPLALHAEYHLATRYAVGGDNSRWDYLRLDPTTHYLYVAHGTKFEVIDVTNGKKVGEIGPARRAHGVVIVPELNRGFATSGTDAAVIVFDSKTLKTISVIPTQGKNPDAIQYDSEDTKKVYVVNGASGTVAVIDPAKAEVTGLAHVADGKLEQICFDGRGRAFVNNEDKSSVHVFDTHTLKPIATWSAAPGEGGTGLDIDQKNHRLFSSCANSKLVVFNTDTGKVVATPAIGEDADGVVFDPASGLLFASNADQTMTIVHEDTPDQYTVRQTVPTGIGAKQLEVDSETGRVFLPTAKFGPKPAPTEKVPNPSAPVLPDSFEILVFEK